METTTLHTAVQKCYEHLFDAIVRLANNPDDDDCIAQVFVAHNDYDRALEAYVLAREKETREGDRGELPF